VAQLGAEDASLLAEQAQTKHTDAASNVESNGERKIQYPIVCQGQTRDIYDLKFSELTQDGYFLVNGSHDKLPMLRWGDNGDWIGTFRGHKGAVWSAAFNSDATKVATASGDFSFCLWDAINGKMLHKVDHGHIVRAVEFSPKDDRLLSGGQEQKLRVFDLKTVDFPCVREFETSAAIQKASWLPKKDEEVTNLIVAGLANGCMLVVDTSEEEVEVVKEWQEDFKISDVEVCRSQNTLVVAGARKVAFYSLDTLDLIKALDLNFNVEGASMNPKGGQFVAGGQDLCVHVFDFETGKELRVYKGHHGPVYCVRYRSDGKVFASGSEDSTIRLWQFNNE